MSMRKNYNKKTSETGARIGEVRFSYCHVFEKFDSNGDENNAKYSTCVLIPKEDKATLKLLEEIVESAKKKGPAKTKGWSGGKIPARLTLPLRDGDEEEKGPEYEGMMFFNCNSPSSKPGVRVLHEGKLVEALDDEDFYSGCWGAVTVSAFAYDSNGNKGVSLALNNIIKTRDDERLAGGATAEQDFKDMEDDLA